MDLKDYIAIRLDWPKPGISFKDITPLLQNSQAFKEAIEQMCAPFLNKKVDKVLCADARGFIFGSAIAYKLNAGLAIARKPNKLPYISLSEEYSLEYGTNTLEIPPHAIDQGDNVIIIDDLLATGGSAKALTSMCEKVGANLLGYSFLIELTGLKGSDRLADKPIYSLIKYEF